MFCLNKMWKNIQYHHKMKRYVKEVEYAEIQLDEFILLDVRSKREYKEYHLNNAINLPLPEIRNISKLITNKDKKVLVYCQSGIRSIKAIIIMEDLGYTNVYNLKGGLENI